MVPTGTVMLAGVKLLPVIQTSLAPCTGVDATGVGVLTDGIVTVKPGVQPCGTISVVVSIRVTVCSPCPSTTVISVLVTVVFLLYCWCAESDGNK